MVKSYGGKGREKGRPGEWGIGRCNSEVEKKKNQFEKHHDKGLTIKKTSYSEKDAKKVMLPTYGNNGAGPSSNAISLLERGFQVESNVYDDLYPISAQMNIEYTYTCINTYIFGITNKLYICISAYVSVHV